MGSLLATKKPTGSFSVYPLVLDVLNEVCPRPDKLYTPPKRFVQRGQLDKGFETLLKASFAMELVHGTVGGVYGQLPEPGSLGQADGAQLWIDPDGSLRS